MTFRSRLSRLAGVWMGALVPPSAAQNPSAVQVAPPSITIKVGERYGLLATAFDRAGNVMPTVRPVWSSNNVQVARVDNTGTVVGVAAGLAIVEARVGQRRGQAAVPVTSGGAAPPVVTAGQGAAPADGGGLAVDPLAG